MLGVDHDPGTEAVCHDPAGDFARRSPLQRSDYLEAVVIRQPNIKDQVHVILRGIDVRDQRLNAGIGIRQQSSVVTTHGLETIHRMPHPEEVAVTFRNFRLQSWRIRSRRVGDTRHTGQHFTHAAHATTPNIRLTEEKIRDHTHDG